MEEYNFFDIETKWQNRWEEMELFHADDSSQKPKYYCLMMFPYPSGKLHVGHGRNYIIGDAVARYAMMKGYNVMNPMGWDSFGLPAENYAIKAGRHPKQTTEENIAFMKQQMKRWGVGFDWAREIASYRPDYYKWTQWLFLKFYEKGLAYRKNAPVNWCPGCNTVLANEQVIEGKCERSGDNVIQKDMEQWFFKITDYSDRLLEDVEKLANWPERVKALQKNWIGKSTGCYIDFELEGECSDVSSIDEFLSYGVRRTQNDNILMRVFTTRPDTAYGVTFVSIAPEHPMLKKLLECDAVTDNQRKEVLMFIDECRGQSALERESEQVEKKGVFTGRYVRNPLDPDGDKLPLYAANYVLMYGTGIVMAVPAHDQRDFEFAKKHNIKIKQVVRPGKKGSEWDKPLDEWGAAYTEPGVSVNSDKLSNLKTEAMMKAVEAELEKIRRGGAAVVYRLRDWLLSRQRYWGAPIPMVYCPKCGVVPVKESDLPVLLPEDVDFKNRRGNPLEASEGFVQTQCPNCNEPARRETDTMDTFVCSSWYFLRYISPQNDEKLVDSELADYWLPVDQYIGGIEHATGHLIYSRFFTKVLYDMGIIGFDEPFVRLFTQGMICKEAYWCSNCGFRGESERVNEGDIVCCKTCGTKTMVSLQKMSKSKYNVVAPEPLIEKFGADTQRLYTLFIGPPERDAEWNDRGVVGSYRFLNRLWEFVHTHFDSIKDVSMSETFDVSEECLKTVRRKTHQTIKKVSHNIEENFHFNTAISFAMELLNELKNFEKNYNPAEGLHRKTMREAVESLVLVTAPMVPHIAEELWGKITEAKGKTVFHSSWPRYDEQLAKEELVELAVQINGKIRDRVTIEAGLPDEKIKELVLSSEKVQMEVGGRTIKKVVIVPGRLVNVVVIGGQNEC